MEQTLVEKIKSTLTCVRVAKMLGLNITKSGDRCKSFRTEATNDTSLHIFEDFWVDYGNGNNGGDCIKLLAEAKGITNGKAISYLAKELNIKTGRNYYKKFDNYEQIIETAINAFNKNIPKEKRKYFHSRGITDETIDKFKLGYGIKAGLTKQFEKDEVSESGILQTYKRFVIPYMEFGRVKYIITREDPDEPSGIKYKKIKKVDFTENPIFGIDSIQKKHEVYIVEGMFDALSLLQEGYPVISPITGTFSGQQKKMLYNILKDKKVTICFDYDPSSKAGQRNTEKLAQDFIKRGINVFTIRLNGGDEKVDISSLYQKDKEMLLEQIFPEESDYMLHIIDKVTTRQGAREIIKILTTSWTKSFAKEYVDYMVNKFPKWKIFIKEEYNTQIQNNERVIIENIMNKYELRYMPNYGFYQYDPLKTIWEEIEEEEFGKYITDEMGYEVTGSKLRSILTLGRVLASEKGLEFNKNKEWFSVKNGMVNIQNCEIRKRTKEDYVTITTEYEYNKKANTDIIEQFISDIANQHEGRIRLLKQIMGYCLTKDVKYHKAFILYGKGRNGKSVFLDMLINMVGKANVSSIGIDSMTDHFQLINIKDKMINISTEIATQQTADSDVFKKVVAGDYVSACKKNKDFIDFRPFAKMIFATNKIMGTSDTSQGYMDRIVFIDFPCKYVASPEKPNEKQIIENYLPKFILPNMSAVLNVAIEGLHDLTQTGKFIETEESMAHKEDMKKANNQIYSFIVETDINNRAYTMTELYSQYEAWARKTNSGTMSKRRFNQEVKETADMRLEENVPAYMKSSKEPRWFISP